MFKNLFKRAKPDGSAPPGVAYIPITEPNLMSEPTPPATAPAPILLPARDVPLLKLQLAFRANSTRCSRMAVSAPARFRANMARNKGGFVDVEKMLREHLQDRASENQSEAE